MEKELDDLSKNLGSAMQRVAVLEKIVVDQANGVELSEKEKEEIRILVETEVAYEAMEEEMNKVESKAWFEYTSEEREKMTDMILSPLRDLMLQPDADIKYSQETPIDHGVIGLRYTGYKTIKVEVVGRLKPYCHLCGNSGRVTIFGVHEPKHLPICSCKKGQALKARE